LLVLLLDPDECPWFGTSIAYWGGREDTIINVTMTAATTTITTTTILIMIIIIIIIIITTTSQLTPTIYTNHSSKPSP